MKITGEMLKNERINKNLSLQDVATSLKLNSKMVASIEAGDMDALPAKTFVRGFVKSYAQLLKLDPDVVLRQFQEEMGTTSPLPKVPPPKPGEVKPVKAEVKSSMQSADAKAFLSGDAIAPDSSKNVILMIGIALGLIVVLVISNKIIESFKENPVAVESATESQPTEPSTVAASADTTAPETTADTSSQASSDASVASAQEVTNAAPAASSATAAPQTQEEVFPPSSGSPVELILEAKKDIEIFYAKGNSRNFYSLKLTPNQIQVIRSKAGLHIKSSDGGAFKISVNGVEKGNAGPSNSAVKLSF